ncbi:hypothetical protein LJB88_05465 [Erysipelotrichaceae bacterium OttesenSCG-928-M19]|nr:hypothetical protein [Erysipelotrichaceae bacterium OttesenSCG-928-M19]
MSIIGNELDERFDTVTRSFFGYRNLSRNEKKLVNAEAILRKENPEIADTLINIYDLLEFRILLRDLKTFIYTCMDYGYDNLKIIDDFVIKDISSQKNKIVDTFNFYEFQENYVDIISNIEELAKDIIEQRKIELDSLKPTVEDYKKNYLVILSMMKKNSNLN